MSEDRIAGGLDPAEEDSVTDRKQHSDGCFQVSALCCCVPRRRVFLPGRKPRERKKKNAGGLSFRDIMLEEEMDQAYWNISMDDQESVQTEAIKPTLPLCPQAYGTEDHCIPLPIGTFYLEEKQDYDEKSGVKPFQKQGEATKPSKERLNDLSVLCSEKENRSMLSEGLPLEKEASYQGIPDNESRQAGIPESLGALVQEVAHEKEQQEGGDNASVLSEGMSCKKVWEKQQQQAGPFQELEQCGKREDRSPLPDTEIKMQEEQNNSTDDEGVTSLKELFIESWIPCREEQHPLGKQQLAKDVACKVEEQATWDKMNAVPKEDTDEKVQDSSNTLYQKVWHPVELKYLDSLPINDKKNEQEPSEVLHHVNILSETSHNEAKYKDKKTVDPEVQQPFIAKAMSYLFQDTSYEKDQEQIQGMTNTASDSPVNKSEEHQYIPHQENINENRTTFQTDVTWAIDEQMNDNMSRNGLGYTTEQNNLKKQSILLVEHDSSTYHHRKSHEKEPQVGADHSDFGSQGIAFPEEQENSGLIISETSDTPPDNMTSEKEQQRKLECGDSGSESLYDKEEQDCQAALYLERPPPLELLSVPLSKSPETEQDGRNSGILEMNCQEEQAVEYGDQSKKLLTVSSQEKEAKEDQEDQDTTMFSSTQWYAEGEEMESWCTPNNKFMPYKDHPQRDQFDLGMTCEEHQRKEKLSLSESRLYYSSREDEEDM